MPTGLLDKYNARWNKPADVAKTFVPIVQFQRLTRPTNSVLLGPRGSGKTTLLKMLTRSAIRFWDQHRSLEYPDGPFEYPEFEAIYIPSDVRWFYEVGNLGKGELDERRMEVVQRIVVSSAILSAMTEAAEEMLELTSDDETVLGKAIIDFWRLRGCIARLSNIRLCVKRISSDVRGAVRIANSNRIDDLLADLPTSFASHVLDVPMQFCEIMKGLFCERLRFELWAFCFDELELAPTWLQDELWDALRSIEQPYLLKLTTSPLLPTGLRSGPQEMEDFTPING